MWHKIPTQQKRLGRLPVVWIMIGLLFSINIQISTAIGEPYGEPNTEAQHRSTALVLTTSTEAPNAEFEVVQKPKLSDIEEVVRSNEPYDLNRRFTGNDQEIAKVEENHNSLKPFKIWSLYQTVDYRKSHINYEPCDRTNIPTGEVDDDIFWFDLQVNADFEQIEISVTDAGWYVLLVGNVMKHGPGGIDWSTFSFENQKPHPVAFGYNYYNTHPDIGRGKLGLCIDTGAVEFLFDLFGASLEQFGNELKIEDPVTRNKLEEKIRDHLSNIASKLLDKIIHKHCIKLGFWPWVACELGHYSGITRILTKQLVKPLLTPIAKKLVDEGPDALAKGPRVMVAEFIAENIFVHHKKPLNRIHDGVVSLQIEQGFPKLSWINNNRNGTDGIIIYRINMDKQSDNHEFIILPNSQSAFTDKSVNCNNSYVYWLTQTNRTYHKVNNDYLNLPEHGDYTYFGEVVNCQRITHPTDIPYPQTSLGDPPDIPQPVCDQSQTGVILYAERNYQGRCIRLFEGKYNLADYKLDNAVSSIWINGNYRVDMYKDANLGEPRDEFHQSDDNIDDRSLGEQWSSIKITNKAKQRDCGDGKRDGVYFYRDKDFKGDCFYTTTDIADFTQTNIGNNHTSSARIVGDWEVTVYKSQNFQENSYTFTKSKGNLDDKPEIGSNISSARVKPKPKACPAPTLLQPISGSMLGNRTVTFTWGGISCERTDGSDLYRLRIKTVPNMESGGEIVFDQQANGTSQAITLDARWERLPLYWSVQVGNPKNGAAWANARLLTVDTNQPPTVVIQQANGQAIITNEQFVWGNLPTWTLNGNASDADGSVVRVDVACNGQSCNDTNPANLNSNAWSYQREGLEGRNHLHVQAVDNLGAVSNGDNPANLTLWVDRAAPQTGLVLNGSANPATWPQWFTDPVVVLLAASDAGSGSGANLARAGVKEIRYRLDNGEWQTQSGDQLYLELSTSGVHTVDYYAVDNVGNAEAAHTQTISLDLTPPTPPGAASERSGVVNDQWQNRNAVPVFDWGAATDDHAGVWGYQLYFGSDPMGEGYYTVRAGESLSWRPHENGATTGSYFLRGRARDLAGNWSDWANLFTFRYDNTPPPNPTSAQHAAGIVNDR